MVLQKLQAPKINNLLFKLPFQQFSNETGNTSPGNNFWIISRINILLCTPQIVGLLLLFFQMIEMPFRFVSLPPFLMKKVRVVACHVLNNFHAERERERERDLKVNPEFEKMTAVLSNAICYQGSLPTAGECWKKRNCLLQPKIVMMDLSKIATYYVLNIVGNTKTPLQPWAWVVLAWEIASGPKHSWKYQNSIATLGMGDHSGTLGTVGNGFGPRCCIEDKCQSGPFIGGCKT